jgi:hypothetical protein
VTYDRKLDDRVAQIVLPWGAERKSMFGGTGYMLPVSHVRSMAWSSSCIHRGWDRTAPW